MVAVVSLWKLRGGGGSSSDEATVNDSNLVLDRIWIDHIPKNDRDTINVFVAITEEPFGVFQAASQWKGQFELFRYEAHGNEIRILYPQTNEREKVKTRATKCDERQMDYCLELDGATRGVKKYYSRKGWEIDRNATAEQVRSKVEALLVSTEAEANRHD
ncbi:MAG: hypothetical protein KF773_11615 [Deltaproteobacteria bacterium]|nr:hypothetical protein [Deltaproteobacteria bacterium]